MAILKCNMCGGTLDYDREQDLAVCPYCGNKSTVFDHDRKLFEQFQDQFAALLNQSPKAAPEEGFWVDASREELTRADGRTIEIAYLTKRRADLCTMYVARHNIIYVFESGHADYAARYREMVGKLHYPTPEMERELANYVPRPVTECRLADGRLFLAIEKKEGTYPLKMLGRLTHRHVAWVVSRLENLCCLLDHNDMVLNAFTAENLFADPADHQLYLYGGWWFAGYTGAEIIGASESVIPYLEKNLKSASFHTPNQKNRYIPRTDLESIRLVAVKLLGYPDREALREEQTSASKAPLQEMLLPEPFRQFLLQPPKPDARADFAQWDRVLEESYGERRFIPLSVTEEEIYSKSGEKI
ncbi:MAG: hypothetical protein NC420_14780 [Eubacterium sp.]|nr:hypothetical protein [Eubacterium sp.]MCM1302587.1 hypothetical protein [Butyrivibrio sp.]MCM1342284.1 hypothetical protein [Muribaculaceae bacterium]MCM1410925.1 hypothetical protein [Lachnospiraceae bacterium]